MTQPLRILLSVFSGIVLSALGLACSDGSAPPQAVQNRPNIVLILADDMGYGDPGRYNAASKIPTPNMDRLAQEGIWFTDAHSPSGVCTPTRYGLLTGRYAWRTRLKRGVLRGYSPSLIDTNRVTLASLLKQHGYATAGVGKWHLGLGSEERTDYSQPLYPGPNALGFDYYFGIPASLDMVPYLYFENTKTLAQPTDSVGPSGYEYGGPYWRAGPMAPGFRHIDVMPDITEAAVAYIEQQAAETPDTPFFLYVPLSAPHTPWLPTEPFRGKSQAGDYGDFTAMVDGTVGQVMDALDRLNLTDNTLFIVTSDNGSFWIQDDIDRYDHRSNHHLRGMKADIWEGGHRVPFIARWPGRIKPDTKSDQVISLTDMLATFAAIIGAELPEDAGEDSYNILPALLGASLDGPIREATVHHSADGMFAIRQGPWKLIEGRGSGGFSEPRRIEPGPGEPPGQLYNLAEDPAETNNLYLDRPDIVERLAGVLEQYRQQGHSRPLVTP